MNRDMFGEYDELDNLLDRLGVKENVTRMKEDARKDMADLIENSSSNKENENSEVHHQYEDAHFVEIEKVQKDNVHAYDSVKKEYKINEYRVVKVEMVTRKWGMVNRQYFKVFF